MDENNQALGIRYSATLSVRSQKSEVRSQKSEVRSQNSEVRSQKSEVRSQRLLTFRSLGAMQRCDPWRISFLMRKKHHYGLGEAVRSWGFPHERLHQDNVKHLNA
ncbi:MAG: hypothetical protein F6K65_19635 [Moorea sp. SIO3C2]|nr:hypothetical protein [Moorena sp. SIO3C2]